MSKKDRLRFLKAGLVFRSGSLVSPKLVERVESAISDKQDIIGKLIDTWKKDIRREIKKQGISYLVDFDIALRLKENMETIESNHMLKALSKSINLTEDDVREAMETTLSQMKSEYGLGA